MLNRTTERDSSPKSHGTRTETFGKLFGSCWATKVAEAIARWKGPKLWLRGYMSFMATRVHRYRIQPVFLARALPGTLEFRPDCPIAKEIGQATLPRRKRRLLRA